MFCYVSNNEQIACCICSFFLAVELVNAHAWELQSMGFSAECTCTVRQAA